MQDAGDQTRLTAPGAPSRVGRGAQWKVRLDCDGLIIDAACTPGIRCGMHYAELFDEADRARGLPEQLLRLAAQYECVRDEVLRGDNQGGLTRFRVVLRVLRDEHDALRGFEETATCADFTSLDAFLDSVGHSTRSELLRSCRAFSTRGKRTVIAVLRPVPSLLPRQLAELRLRCGSDERLAICHGGWLVLLRTGDDLHIARARVERLIACMPPHAGNRVRRVEHYVWSLPTTSETPPGVAGGRHHDARTVQAPLSSLHPR